MRLSLLVMPLLIMLSGCTTIELVADLAKKGFGSDARYKIGAPYEIYGVWYYPERDLNYDETGIASWYGDEFAGKPTANGETFNPSIVSAAHKTLPMPSAVRVINLENGRSLVVRVNDRGPFVSGRIIDLSREAARLLGFKDNGIARVRVQILAEESLRLEREAKAGRFPKIGKKSRQPQPKVNSAAVPSSSLKSKDNTDDEKSELVSAIDLISSNRETDVIELTPVSTNIFVQVGAFKQESNAQAVFSKISDIDRSAISHFDDDGVQIFRVRIGPLTEIAAADKVLDKVIKRGFRSAKIVLD